MSQKPNKSVFLTVLNIVDYYAHFQVSTFCRNSHTRAVVPS